MFDCENSPDSLVLMLVEMCDELICVQKMDVL